MHDELLLLIVSDSLHNKEQQFKRCVGLCVV